MQTVNQFLKDIRLQILYPATTVNQKYLFVSFAKKLLGSNPPLQGTESYIKSLSSEQIQFLLSQESITEDAVSTKTFMNHVIARNNKDELLALPRQILVNYLCEVKDNKMLYSLVREIPLDDLQKADKNALWERLHPGHITVLNDRFPFGKMVALLDDDKIGNLLNILNSSVSVELLKQSMDTSKPYSWVMTELFEQFESEPKKLSAWLNSHNEKMYKINKGALSNWNSCIEGNPKDLYPKCFTILNELKT